MRAVWCHKARRLKPTCFRPNIVSEIRKLQDLKYVGLPTMVRPLGEYNLPTQL